MDPLAWLYFLIAIGALCAIWGIGIERYLFKVRYEGIKVLPRGADPIRVLHVSDFHLAPWQKRKQAFIRDLIELKPDLVVNTGDNLGHHDAIGPLLDCISPLFEVPGVFVNGSNDYHSPTFRNPLSYLFKSSEPTHHNPIDTEKMTDAFERGGWLNLNNQSGSLTVQGLEIGFIGLDDAHDGLADLKTLPKQSAEVGLSQFMLGVTHAPYLNMVEGLTLEGAKMIFAGHTHGGQVCLPIKGALVTNCDLPTKNAKGVSEWKFAGKKSWLNVCAGLGTSIFAPVRFFCAPEVRLVTLLAQD